MKRVCIHQPDFAPYLGFFQRLLSVDEFIILDDVQFLRRGWHHRDKVKTPAGIRWLTLAVRKGPQEQRIDEVSLCRDPRWVEQNLALLREGYRRAPAFDALFPRLEAVYRATHERLVDFNLAILELLYGLLELEVRATRSSSLAIPGRSNHKLIGLLRAVGATHYLSGSGARAYLDEAQFAAAGIQVEWQRFEHPVYPQLHGEFVPYLSTLDLAFNCGRDASRVLRSCAAHP